MMLTGAYVKNVSQWLVMTMNKKVLSKWAKEQTP